MRGLRAGLYRRSLSTCTLVSCHHISWSFCESTESATGAFSFAMAFSP